MIQKIFATLMTYSISFQLILGGIPIAMLSSTTAQARDCGEGLEWSAILNRCLTSRQAAQVQSASTRCQKITDKAAQNRCYVGALEAQVVEAENDNKIEKENKLDPGKLSLLLAMATLVSSITTLKYLKGGDCKAATSAWLMAGGSAAVFAGEIMSGYQFQKKSKEAFDEFKSIKEGTSENEGSEVQSEAIGAMIKREDAVIDAAKTKKMLYMVAMVAYAAAGTMAIFEAIKYKMALAQPGSAAVATAMYVCYKSKAAAPEQAAALKSAGAEKALGLFGQGAAWGTGKAVGWAAGATAVGAIGGSFLLGDGLNRGTNNLINSSGSSSSSGASSSGSSSGSSGGDGEGSGDNPDTENPIEDETIIQNYQPLSIDEYLTAYFERGRKTNFQKYTDLASSDLSSIDSASNWEEYYQILTDIKRFQAGELVSSSVEEYENTVSAVKQSNIISSEEDFTVLKFATKITQQFAIQQASAKIDISDKTKKDISLISGLAMILGTGIAAPMLIAKSAKLTTLFVMPVTRATLAGTMAGVSYYMQGKTQEEADKAQKRKDFLEKLQLQVEASGTAFGTCTAEQRERDLSKPHCYCYLQGGTINTARVKSATCKTFFGSGLAKNFQRPPVAADARDTRSCTTPNATVIDENCGCRRTNTCLVIPPATFTAAGTNPSAIGNFNTTLDGINNGLLDPASINPQDLILRAAALGRKQQALLKDPKNKSLLNDIKKADQMGLSAMRSLAGGIASSPALMGANLGNMGSGVGNSSPQEELKKLQEEFKKDMKQYEPGSIGGGNGNALGAAGDDFNLDAMSGGVTVEDEKLAEVMDTNFEATGSDINSNSDANIFQILTYRYQRSAMRRLFGGESMLPADKANETEISD